MSNQEFEYDVALSFAGEERDYVDRVATTLKSENISVFYDAFEEAKLWGKDLYEYLDEIYKKKAKYCIIFISKNYAKKLWTTHERKSAQERAFTESEEYILPARFDDTVIPGIRSTVGYIDLTKNSPEQFCEIIKQKLKFDSKKKSQKHIDSKIYQFQFYPNISINLHFNELHQAIDESLLLFRQYEAVGPTYKWPKVFFFGSSNKIKNGISYNFVEERNDIKISYKGKLLKDGSIHLLTNIIDKPENKFKGEFELDPFLHDLIAFIFMSCKWIDFFKKSRSVNFNKVSFGLKFVIPENTVLRCSMNQVEARYFIPKFGRTDGISEVATVEGNFCESDQLQIQILDQLINSVVSEFEYNENNQIRFANMKLDAIKIVLKNMQQKKFEH